MANISVDVQRSWGFNFDNSTTPVTVYVQMSGNVRSPDSYAQLVFGDWGNAFIYDPSQATNISLNRFQTVAAGLTYYETDMWTFILSRMNAVGSPDTFVSGAIYSNPNNASSYQPDWNQTDNTTFDYIKNKPSINTTRTTSTLTLNPVGTGATGTQISATKDSSVRVTYSTSTTSTLAGSNTSQVVVKICSTNSSTEANWTEVGRTASNQPSGISVVIGQVISQAGQITVDVPASWYVKAVNSGTGTHSEAFVSGQQTIYG